MKAWEYIMATKRGYNVYSDFEDICPSAFELLKRPKFCKLNCGVTEKQCKECWNRDINIESCKIKLKEREEEIELTAKEISDILYIAYKIKEQAMREENFKKWEQRYKQRPNIDLMKKAILTPMGNKR